MRNIHVGKNVGFYEWSNLVFYSQVEQFMEVLPRTEEASDNSHLQAHHQWRGYRQEVAYRSSQ